MTPRPNRKPIARCRFSKKGIEWLSPRRDHREREGDLVSDGPKLRYVKWDGLRSAHGYARDFIETITAPADLADPLGR